MLFEEYLTIVRSMFFASFGPVAESAVLEFFLAGVDAVQAAIAIGNGFAAELL